MTTHQDTTPEKPAPLFKTADTAINRNDHDDGTTELTVMGELDWIVTGHLATTILACEGATTVTVDLRGLVWADSSVLHVLISTQRHRNTALILRGPLQPVTERLFTLTGTHDYFTFDNTDH